MLITDLNFKTHGLRVEILNYYVIDVFSVFIVM